MNPLQTSRFKLVTIVAERLLEERLLADIKALGAHGWTITDVRGQGSRGVRASDWEGGNVKIETVVAADVAGRILELLAARYFTRFAVIGYVTDLEVVRGDKFA